MVNQLTPTNLQDKTTHQVLVLNYLLSGTRRLAIKSQLSTLVESTKCTRLRTMAKYTQGTHTRPTAKANKCTCDPIACCTHKDRSTDIILEIDTPDGYAPT